MTAEAEPIIDTSCNCERCTSRTTAKYDLPGRCLNCGATFTVRSRKGDRPPTSHCRPHRHPSPPWRLVILPYILIAGGFVLVLTSFFPLAPSDWLPRSAVWLAGIWCVVAGVVLFDLRAAMRERG